jgi:hypothetical protein
MGKYPSNFKLFRENYIKYKNKVLNFDKIVKDSRIVHSKHIFKFMFEFDFESEVYVSFIEASLSKIQFAFAILNLCVKNNKLDLYLYIVEIYGIQMKDAEFIKSLRYSVPNSEIIDKKEFGKIIVEKRKLYFPNKKFEQKITPLSFIAPQPKTCIYKLNLSVSV